MSHLGLDGLLAVSARDGHGRLEEGALEVDAVLRQVLVHLSENLLLDAGGRLEVVVAVHENLRLDDGDEAGLLAGASIAGEAPGSLLLAEGSRGLGGDLEDHAPLAEAGALLVVGLRAAEEAVEASAPCLDGVATREGLEASVNLDARDNAKLLQAIDEGGAVSVVLVQGLFVENGARDVLAEA